MDGKKWIGEGFQRLGHVNNFALSNVLTIRLGWTEWADGYTGEIGENAAALPLVLRGWPILTEVHRDQSQCWLMWLNMTGPSKLTFSRFDDQSSGHDTGIAWGLTGDDQLPANKECSGFKLEF